MCCVCCRLLGGGGRRRGTGGEGRVNHTFNTVERGLSNSDIDHICIPGSYQEGSPRTTTSHSHRNSQPITGRHDVMTVLTVLYCCQPVCHTRILIGYVLEPYRHH